MVFFVMLIFVGQSLASTVMTYKMSAGEMPTQMMSHSDHDMTADMVEMEGMDCCAQDCDCTVGHCAAAALPGLFVATDISIFSQKIDNYSGVFTPQPAYSLFRPPISR